MEIQIDEEKISDVINKSATKALEESIGGYDVQSAIIDVVTKEMITGTIAEAIKLAVHKIDTKALTTVIAEEMQRTMVMYVVSILKEGMTSLICKMRGIGDYTSEDKKEREKIMANFRIK